MPFDKKNPETLLLMNAFYRNKVKYLIVGFSVKNKHLKIFKSRFAHQRPHIF